MACVVCQKIYSFNDGCQVDSDEKPHLCTTCGLSFTFKIQLKRHMILHADGAPYTCKYCVNDNKGKTYNLRLGNKSEYACEVCHKCFSNKRMLSRHSIQHTYESEDILEEKIKTTIKKRSAPHKSKHLSKKTSEREPVKLSIKRHFKEKTKSLICDSCNKGFAYQACLDKHIKMGKCSSLSSIKQSPKHFSDDCKESQNDKHLPSNSRNMESKDKHCDNSEKIDLKKHVCSVCGKTFTRKSSLDGHELSHILNKETSEDEKYFSDSEITDEDIPLPKKSRISTFRFQKSFMCDKCNFVCFSKPTWDKHVTNHHKKDLPSSKEGKDMQKTKEYRDSSPKENHSDNLKSLKTDSSNSRKCEKCNKKFKNEAKFLKHHCVLNKEEVSMDVNKKKLVCEICNETFISKKDLRNHLLSHVEINTDDSSLDRKEAFTKHRIKKSKNFACEICSRRFAGEICLKKHMLKHGKESVETDGKITTPSVSQTKKIKPVKELICKYCKEEFTGKKSAYIKHIHAHTPEVCGICDDRFIDRQSLREHCKIHVGTEEGKMFMQCSQKALDAKNGLLAPEPKVEYIYLVLR